jgi:hypothetical protein
VKTEESGMILSVNASARKALSGMALNVSDAPLASFMQLTAATAHKELSLTELNVQSEQVTNASVFQIQIGTEPTAFASQVSQPAVTHVSVTVLSLVTTASDAPQNPTQSGPTASANATTVTST